MSEQPNWPTFIRPGTWLYWSELGGEYYLTNYQPYESTLGDTPCLADQVPCGRVSVDRLSRIIDHDWQIPDEPDPIKRKWRKE